MKLHLLSGFLGSGKTTAIQQAVNYLSEKDTKTGVITNDQGTRLVDGDFFKSLKIPEEQVAGSCFCCNYNALDNKIEALIATHDVDLIFAESVGSCTDVVATVFNPLLQFRSQLQVTVSTFADAALLYSLLKENKQLFDEDVKYIYYKQLEEAGVVVVSKIDLISEAQLEELKEVLRKDYKYKIIHYQNSYDTNNIEKWLELLNDFKSETELQSLEIDYGIYGSGEARLAWLDEEIEIHSIDNNAIEIVINLINSIFSKIKKHDYSIGHVKFLINGDTKVGFTSTTPVTYVYKAENQKAATATLLINARVQTTPETLSSIVATAIDEEEKKWASKIIVKSLSSFKPGYPKPTYRIINTAEEDKFLIAQKFMLSLVKAGAEVFRVSGMEEVKSLYYKSGPGIENIVNTIPELGLVNEEKSDVAEPRPVYQMWVQGALGVAENGKIWFERSKTIGSLFPFIGEYLIVVISVNEIVADMQAAKEKIKNSSEEYKVISKHKASNLIIYIINKQSGKTQKQEN